MWKTIFFPDDCIHKYSSIIRGSFLTRIHKSEQHVKRACTNDFLGDLYFPSLYKVCFFEGAQAEMCIPSITPIHF